jgi:hypothetical protein
MSPLPAIALDTDHSKRKVYFVVNDYHITYGDLSERKKGLQGLTTSVHEGLGLEQAPGPITNSNCPLAVAVALDPARAGKITGECRSGVTAAISLHTASIPTE